MGHQIRQAKLGRICHLAGLKQLGMVTVIYHRPQFSTSPLDIQVWTFSLDSGVRVVTLVKLQETKLETVIPLIIVA